MHSSSATNFRTQMKSPLRLFVFSTLMKKHFWCLCKIAVALSSQGLMVLILWHPVISLPDLLIARKSNDFDWILCKTYLNYVFWIPPVLFVLVSYGQIRWLVNKNESLKKWECYRNYERFAQALMAREILRACAFSVANLIFAMIICNLLLFAIFNRRW